MDPDRNENNKHRREDDYFSSIIRSSKIPAAVLPMPEQQEQAQPHKHREQPQLQQDNPQERTLPEKQQRDKLQQLEFERMRYRMMVAQLDEKLQQLQHQQGQEQPLSERQLMEMEQLILLWEFENEMQRELLCKIELRLNQTLQRLRQQPQPQQQVPQIKPQYERSQCTASQPIMPASLPNNLNLPPGLEMSLNQTLQRLGQQPQPQQQVPQIKPQYERSQCTASHLIMPTSLPNNLNLPPCPEGQMHQTWQRPPQLHGQEPQVQQQIYQHEPQRRVSGFNMNSSSQNDLNLPQPRVSEGKIHQTRQRPPQLLGQEPQLQQQIHQHGPQRRVSGFNMNSSSQNDLNLPQHRVSEVQLHQTRPRPTQQLGQQPQLQQQIHQHGPQGRVPHFSMTSLQKEFNLPQSSEGQIHQTRQRPPQLLGQEPQLQHQIHQHEPQRRVSGFNMNSLSQNDLNLPQRRVSEGQLHQTTQRPPRLLGQEPQLQHQIHQHGPKRRVSGFNMNSSSHNDLNLPQPRVSEVQLYQTRSHPTQQLGQQQQLQQQIHQYGPQGRVPHFSMASLQKEFNLPRSSE